MKKLLGRYIITREEANYYDALDTNNQNLAAECVRLRQTVAQQSEYIKMAVARENERERQARA